jgi:hypothetical protein
MHGICMHIIKRQLAIVSIQTRHVTRQTDVVGCDRKTHFSSLLLMLLTRISSRYDIDTQGDPPCVRLVVTLIKIINYRAEGERGMSDTIFTNEKRNRIEEAVAPAQFDCQ